MEKDNIIELVQRIQRHQCEFQNIEVKAANGGCPTKLYDTLSSFSNQDNGGIIVCGLDEKQAFKVVGVYDSQDIQHRINEQCKQMQPTVRPLFSVSDIDDKTVVTIEIPGVDISERPVFYKGIGRIKGSFIRSGEADELMSEYEIYSYDAFRRRIRDDLRLVEDADTKLFNENLVNRFLTNIRANRKNLSINVSDEELFELMGVTKNGKPTLAGVLAFAKYPQAYLPQLCITAVVVPGTDIGDTGVDGERFIANERITGTLTEMLDDAINFVNRNMRIKTIINEQGKRNDKTEFPAKAIREIILNALMHRDYSIHTERVPIRIIMYNDRMEVINEGGLYGRISLDNLGKIHPDTRNPAIANIVEFLGEYENRYSGIPTMYREMEIAGLPEPVFDVKHGTFTVIIYNKMRSRIEENPPFRKTGDVRKNLIDFCKTPRSRVELTEFMGFSRYYVMHSIIQPLITSGELRMTMPEKIKSSMQRYVAV